VGEVLAPFDREFEKVLETNNKQSTLDMVLPEKSLMERTKNPIDQKLSSQDA